MSLFAVLKHNARLALRGNWGKAIAVMLISLAASMVLQALQNAATRIFVPPLQIDPSLALRYGVNESFFQSLAMTTPAEMIILAVFMVLSLFLLAPLHLGSIQWHYNLVHGRPAPIADIFRFYETGAAYRRSLWYDVNLSVRTLLWAIPFFTVPGVIFGASFYTIMQSDEFTRRSQVAMASVGILLSVVLFLLAAVFYSAVVNRYILTAYLLCEDSSLTVREAIRTSVSYTKGYRFSLLWFQLSFFGWVALCTFVLPILYVAPYFNTASAMYARYIIEKNRIATDSTQEFVVEERPAAREDQPVPEQRPHPFEEFRGVSTDASAEPEDTSPEEEKPSPQPGSDSDDTQ